MKDKIRVPDIEDIPAWYEIGIKDASTILIRIHKQAMGLLDLMKKDPPIKKYFQQNFPKFPEFIAPSEKSPWGFGEILVPGISREADWFVYECTLPILRRKNGERLENRNDFAIRATLAMLFQVLWLFEGVTNSDRLQLIVVENIRVDAELYGAALSATLTPTSAKWLSKLGDKEVLLPDIEKVMFSADQYMWEMDRDLRFHRYDFRVRYAPSKWIHLTVPGDACGLDPDFRSDDPNAGYLLGPHNTDSSIQQLTLIVGLAKLHELIRKG